MFLAGYQLGFQNGLCQQVEDPQNLALTARRDQFMWSGGYSTGYKCGREYRLAQWASRLMLDQELANHAKEQRRLRQKHGSVFWFVFWSIGETVSRCTQLVKAVW